MTSLLRTVRVNASAGSGCTCKRETPEESEAVHENETKISAKALVVTVANTAPTERK